MNANKIQATINYVRNPPARGEAKLEFFSEAEEASTMSTLPGQLVPIESARGRTTSLDQQGFQLLSHHSLIEDFGNVELDVTKSDQYINELSKLLKKHTGATRILALGGAKQRYSESAVDKLQPLANAKPARYPHADNTDESSAGQIEFFVQHVAGLDAKNYSRIALYNLWRCVSPPPQDCPLALCDARSIDPDDEVTVTAVTSTHGIGEIRHDTTSLICNPSHRWFYFPDMTRDELIIFKTHDTDSRRARRVAHSAFDNPDCPPDTHPRASVEVRLLALFS